MAKSDDAGDEADTGDAADPEAGWPPRFNDGFIAASAILLLIVFSGIAALVRQVFDDAGLLEAGDDAAQHVAAYVLFVVGVLALLAALLFALIETRKAIVQLPDQAPRPRSAAVPSIDKVLVAFGDRKLSRVLLAIAFVLLLGAAAGSGLVDLSIGDGDSTADPTETFDDSGTDTDTGPED